MNDAQGVRMTTTEANARGAGMEDLPKKLPQVSAPLVIDPGVGKEAATISCFE